MRVETFRVELSGFKVRELPSKRCNCFVVGNFDNFKQFRSNSADNILYGASWDKFEMLFYYETKFIEKLDKKSFEIDLFEKKLLRNSRIGRVVVDLHTLATGPVHHDIMLLNKHNVSVGRLEFDCVFEHVPNMVVSLKDLTLSLPPDFEFKAKKKSCEVYLQISFYPDAKADVIYKTDISRTSSMYFNWQMLSILRPNASTKKMLATKMLIEVKTRKKVTIGVCWVKFKRLFNPADPTAPIPISFKLTKYIHRYHPQHESNEQTAGTANTNGILKGHFLFEHPPMYGQMIEGVHTENGVFRGAAQLASLPKPVFMRNPDSPDGRFSSIGGYYEQQQHRFTLGPKTEVEHEHELDNSLINIDAPLDYDMDNSQISFDEIERQKLAFEREIDEELARQTDQESENKENSFAASNLTLDNGHTPKKSRK